MVYHRPNSTMRVYPGQGTSRQFVDDATNFNQEMLNTEMEFEAQGTYEVRTSNGYVIEGFRNPLELTDDGNQITYIEPEPDPLELDDSCVICKGQVFPSATVFHKNFTKEVKELKHLFCSLFGINPDEEFTTVSNVFCSECSEKLKRIKHMRDDVGRNLIQNFQRGDRNQQFYNFRHKVSEKWRPKLYGQQFSNEGDSSTPRINSMYSLSRLPIEIEPLGTDHLMEIEPFDNINNDDMDNYNSVRNEPHHILEVESAQKRRVQNAFGMGNTNIQIRTISISKATVQRENLQPNTTKTAKGQQEYDPEDFPYPCKYCNKCFRHSSNRSRHTRVTHLSGTASKSEIAKIPINKSLPQLPPEHDIKTTTWPCECGRVFFSNWGLKQHMDEEHESATRCSICNVFCENERAQKEHEITVHKLIPIRPKTAASIQRRNSTILSKLLANPVPKNETQNVPILKTFNGRNIRPLTNNNQTGRFRCRFCSRGFSMKSSKYRHERLHRNPDSGFYIPIKNEAQPQYSEGAINNSQMAKDTDRTCQMCGKTLASYWSLQNHIKSYHMKGSASFDCFVCERPFSILSYMTRHAKTHDPRFYYRCPPFVNCPATLGFFKKYEFLAHFRKEHPNVPFSKAIKPAQHRLHIPERFKEHYRTCQNVKQESEETANFGHFLLNGDEKPEKSKSVHCPICNKKLKNSQILKRHILTLHPKEDEYKCRFCSRSFRTSSNRSNHERSHRASDLTGPINDQPRPNMARRTVPMNSDNKPICMPKTQSLILLEEECINTADSFGVNVVRLDLGQLSEKHIQQLEEHKLVTQNPEYQAMLDNEKKAREESIATFPEDIAKHREATKDRLVKKAIECIYCPPEHLGFVNKRSIQVHFKRHPDHKFYLGPEYNTLNMPLNEKRRLKRKKMGKLLGKAKKKNRGGFRIKGFGKKYGMESFVHDPKNKELLKNAGKKIQEEPNQIDDLNENEADKNNEEIIPETENMTIKPEIESFFPQGDSEDM